MSFLSDFFGARAPEGIFKNARCAAPELSNREGRKLATALRLRVTQFGCTRPPSMEENGLFDPKEYISWFKENQEALERLKAEDPYCYDALEQHWADMLNVVTGGAGYKFVEKLAEISYSNQKIRNDDIC